MSLRLIAKDLYRLQQHVDRLERQLADAPLEKRQVLQRQLDQALAERDQMRRLLDGRLDR